MSPQLEEIVAIADLRSAEDRRPDPRDYLLERAARDVSLVLLIGRDGRPEELSAIEVGYVAAFLCSPLATGITGTTIYVDKGYHAMGRSVPGTSA